MADTKQWMMIKVGAFAGMVGPVLFGTILVVLTTVQYDFMVDIGWPAPGRPRGRLVKRAYPGPLRLGAGLEFYRLGYPADAPRRRAPPRGYERARLMGRSCSPPRGRGGDGAYGLRDRSYLARGAQDATRVDTRPRLRTLRPGSATFFFLPVAAIQGRRRLARPRPLHPRDQSSRHAFDLPP